MSEGDARKHVLVADDDDGSRYLVESLLRGAGYEVRAVRDGEEALEVASYWDVDLLVTDVLMPRMDGYRLVRAWKEDARLSRAPVVFYTATYTDPADERLASDIGVDRFLAKPLEPQALLAEVRDLLEEGRALPGGPKAEEAEVLREYSERLVSKLEEKVVELDGANAELRRALSVLSDEVGVKNALIDRLNGDIAAREGTEEALLAANQALDAVVASSPLPMVALDDDRRVTIWNDAAERLFGWTADEVLGRANPSVPEDLSEDRDVVLDAASAGERRSCETRRRTKDGRTVDVAVFMDTIRGGAALSRNYIAVYQDISERRRMEQLKSDFISAVSHELRTPLTAILGYGDLLAKAAVGHPECHEMAECIHAKAVELDGLVGRLLEAASIQAGSTAISRTPTDVGGFLDGLARDVPVPDGFEMRLDVEAGLPEVPLDRERLGGVLEELVANAFKYSPDGGRVTASASCDGGELRIAVSDEGRGIPREDQQRIFERFTQADMSSTREFPGLGLGLYMARQVVEAHAGRIEVKSERGSGSTFTIVLPLA